MKLLNGLYSLLAVMFLSQNVSAQTNCSNTSNGMKTYTAISTNKVTYSKLIALYRPGCPIDYFTFPNGVKVYVQAPTPNKFSHHLGVIGERAGQDIYIHITPFTKSDYELDTNLLKEEYGNLNVASVLAIRKLGPSSQSTPGPRHFVMTDKGRLYHVYGRGIGSPMASVENISNINKVEKYKVVAETYSSGTAEILLVKYAADPMIYEFSMGGIDPHKRPDLTEADLN
jgi:hypothetical protein